MIAFKRQNFVVHARAEVVFDIPMALSAGYYIFTAQLPENLEAWT